EHRDDERLSAPRCVMQCLLQAIEKQAPVRQTGKAVVRRIVRKLLDLERAFGDVAAECDEARLYRAHDLVLVIQLAALAPVAEHRAEVLARQNRGPQPAVEVGLVRAGLEYRRRAPDELLAPVAG